MRLFAKCLLAALPVLALTVLWSACGGDSTGGSADVGAASHGDAHTTPGVPTDAGTAEPGDSGSAQQAGADATTAQAGEDAASAIEPDAAAALPGLDAASAAQPDSGPSAIGDAGVTYGLLTTVTFSTTYLLDYAQMSSSSYQQAHQSAFQMSAAFTGTYTSATTAIPPTGTTFAVGIHIPASGSDPAAAAVQQQTQSGQTVLSPAVQLQFTSDAIASGANTVGLEQGDTAMLFVIDNPSAASQCISAVGVGSVDVTTATNTTAEGGALALTGSNIVLYHPTATPWGDISSQITGSGQKVCAKQ